MKLKPEIDYTSSTWVEIELWLRDSLEVVRNGLESSNNTAEDTAKLRGQAAFVRKLLAFSSNVG